MNPHSMTEELMHQQEATVQAVPQNYVEHLLRSLGLFDQVANKPKLNMRSIELFAERKMEFEWVHMGNSEIQIGQLINTLQGTPLLLPPRSGHIGDLESIVHVCAGPLDFNYMICGPHQLGYPLIFDFTQTESDTLGVGDWSYLPGSLVQQGEPQRLELFTWDGASFRRRERSTSFFTPFTLGSVDGQLTPLTKLHREACTNLGQFRFRFLSTLLADRQALVRKILHVLLDDAHNQSQPESILKHVFDRSVTLDGRVTRTALQLSGRGFRMGNVLYSGAQEIIDHAMLPIMAAARSEDFVDSVNELPRQMPIFSLSLFHLLMAVLGTHYPNSDLLSSAMTRPCNPHLHWGGTSMAGFPPQRHGHFRGSTKHLRKLFRRVVSEIAEIDPTLFVLLPAGIFNLCPHNSFPDDVECMCELIGRVHQETDHLVGQPPEMNHRIKQITEEWQLTRKTRLSPYFRSRFSSHLGAAESLPAPIDDSMVMPQDFMTLSLQQASMVLGAFDL